MSEELPEDKMSEREFFELILLGLNYTESRVYDDGSLADIMEDSMSSQELHVALTGALSSFLSMTAGAMQVHPTQLLENMRAGINVLLNDIE